MEPSQNIEIEEIIVTISCHMLVGISTQTLKIEGYIKKEKGNSVD